MKWNLVTWAPFIRKSSSATSLCSIWHLKQECSDIKSYHPALAEAVASKAKTSFSQERRGGCCCFDGRLCLFQQKFGHRYRHPELPRRLGSESAPAGFRGVDVEGLLVGDADDKRTHFRFIPGFATWLWALSPQVWTAQRHGRTHRWFSGRNRCRSGRTTSAVRIGIRCWGHGLRGGGWHHTRGSSQVRWRMGSSSLRFSYVHTRSLPSFCLPLIPCFLASGNGRLASWTSILGFVVMMSLDVGLGWGYHGARRTFNGHQSDDDINFKKGQNEVIHSEKRKNINATWS